MLIASNPTKFKLQRPPDVYFSSLQPDLNAFNPASLPPASMPQSFEIELGLVSELRKSRFSEDVTHDDYLLVFAEHSNRPSFTSNPRFTPCLCPSNHHDIGNGLCLAHGPFTPPKVHDQLGLSKDVVTRFR
jgi:hypothetical protein